MSLLEVIALDVADAQRAEAGGADRVELVGTMDDDGLSPDPRVVSDVCAATSMQVRVMVRLRAGFGATAAEVGQMQNLVAAYADAGADGLVLGFLDDAGQVDLPVVQELVGAGHTPWTFHRAIDHCAHPDRAWESLAGLPGLTHVLTAGSADGVECGLMNLVQRAEADPRVATLIMAGGGLRQAQVGPLARAGVSAFHVGSAARLGGSFSEHVDSRLVAQWRALIDAERATSASCPASRTDD